jgi:CO/xanthine dehydrogenase FAD-binding subunit
MLNIKNYVLATSLEEAYELNQKKANRILGGMIWMRQCNYNIATAIDLSALGLDKIEETDDEFSIGCMVTLRELELNKPLNDYTGGIFHDAVCDIVGVQLRNLATVGGSVFGRFGFSDVLTSLMPLDTYVELFKGGRIPLSEFAKMPHGRDILVRIIIKKVPQKSAFECMRNTKTDFSVLNCALSIRGGKAYVAVGARPNMAKLLTFDKIDETLPERVAESLNFESNIRGSAEYRKHLCKVLVKRALEKVNK